MFSSYKGKIFKSYIKKGIVVPYTILGDTPSKFNYYRIGHNGVRLLIDNGYVSDEYANIDITNFSRIKQLDHFFATQDLAVHGVTVAIRSGINIESLSAYDHPYLIDSDPNNHHPIRPDWILKKDNHFINIETDKSTESHSVIVDKVKRYGDIAKQNPNNHYTVLFSLLDDSYKAKYTSKEGRIGNIKTSLVTLPELQLKNLVVYIMSYSRAMKLIEDIILDERPYNELWESINIESVTSVLNNLNEFFAYSFNEIDHYSILPKEPYELFSTVKAYEVSNKAGNQHIALYTFLEEGRVNFLDRLCYLYTLWKGGKFKKPVSRLIALYSNQEELNNDVLGRTFNNVLFGNSSVLTMEHDKDPIFIIRSSKGKMEKVSYEGI